MDHEWTASSRFLNYVVTIVETFLYRKRTDPGHGPLGKLASLLSRIEKKDLIILLELFRSHRSVVTLFHALNLLTRIITDKASGLL